VLQFPFEDVLAQWQAGPPDPNFIREEVSVEVVGWEEVRTTTIFTKHTHTYDIAYADVCGLGGGENDNDLHQEPAPADVC
jgi:hypothetical protein